MAFPVRIYKKHPDQGGRIRKTITTKMLAKRSDAMFEKKLSDEVSGELTLRQPSIKECEFCGKNFATFYPGRSKYCPDPCTKIVKITRERNEGKLRRGRKKNIE